MRVHVCVCVDSVLSRCLIFCQLPAKMPHLSAGGVTCLRACILQYMFMCIGLCCQDVLSATCQAAPCFGRLSYGVCAWVLFVHVDDIYIIIVLKALASILI